jgi:chromosome partitioning protein
MKIIATLNQKGGVGKTTITANLGRALSLLDQRVLLVDIDPQAQLTASMGIFSPPENGIYQLIEGSAGVDEVVHELFSELGLIAPGLGISAMEHRDESNLEIAKKMSLALQQFNGAFDYVFIDAPPSSGLLMASAIFAADEVMIPVTGDYLGLNGLAHLMRTLKKFESFRGRELPLKIVKSRVFARRRLTGAVVEKLNQHLPGRVYQTDIREAAVMAECPGQGKSILDMRPKSRSAEDFRSLALDVLNERVM